MNEQEPSGAASASRASYGSALVFGAMSFGLVAIIGIVSAIVTARIFGVKVIGEYALVYAPTGLVWLLSSIREQAALVRELASLPPREPRVTGLFVAVLTFSTGLTVAVSAIAAVAVWFLFNGAIGQPDLFIPACVSLAVYASIINVGWNLDTIFSSFVSGRKLFWIRLHQAVANVVVAVSLGIVYPSVWSLVIAAAAASASSLVHRLIAVRPLMRMWVPRHVIRGSFATLPDILRFGIRAAPGAVFQGVANELGTWVLGFTGTVAMVGAYNRAWMLGRKFVELSFRIQRGPAAYTCQARRRR